MRAEINCIYTPDLFFLYVCMQDTEYGELILWHIACLAWLEFQDLGVQTEYDCPLLTLSSVLCIILIQLQQLYLSFMNAHIHCTCTCTFSETQTVH